MINRRSVFGSLFGSAAAFFSTPIAGAAFRNRLSRKNAAVHVMVDGKGIAVVIEHPNGDTLSKYIKVDRILSASPQDGHNFETISYAVLTPDGLDPSSQGPESHLRYRI